MKKRNNKVIILIIIGIVFAALLCVFILNYSKDDSSFSLREKKWINDNANNVIDVSVYNNVPIFGKNGKGVIFDLLDDFTNKYGINFNKSSYSIDNSSNLKKIAFRIVNGNLSDNDILLYNDDYVLVSTSNSEIDRISDMIDIDVLVLNSDIGVISQTLTDAINVHYTPKESIEDIKTAISDKECEYAIIPYNMYIDFILENDLNVLFHINDISMKYVLTIEDKEMLGIMKKYYTGYKEEQVVSYKNNFLDEFFLDKNISETNRMEYVSEPYRVGYVSYMPFEDKEENDFVGTLSNYLSGFEDMFDVSFELVYYNSIEELRLAFSRGEIDLVFGNFNTSNLNIDTIKTSSLFKEEYVVLSKDDFVINSVKGLKDKEVIIVKDSYINDLLSFNGIKYVAYKNTNDLLRNVKNDSIVVVDKATYDYYKVRKFADFKELYTGVLSNQYNFVIRDVNKNTTFSQMFSYYVSSVDYNTIRYDYNTNSSVYDFNLLMIFIITLLVIGIIIVLIFILKKRKNKALTLKNNERLKYIDSMTSLKNRAYLNLKIKEWDDNVIYPQSFVIIDLNNIKDINDNHGHEEGDTVIKKAASILIVNQEANTDIIRTDGNEFLIYMVGYSENDVVSYIRKIYKDLKDLPYGYGASIGYSMIMDEVKTVDDAINEATIDMRNKKGKDK